jgi:hypothetical protein
MTPVRAVGLAGLLLAAGCAGLGPEHDPTIAIYWDAARECEDRHRTIHLDRVSRDGDVSAEADAQSRIDRAPFTRCYHEGIARRVEEWRRQGKPLPERINLTPSVELD